MRKGKAHRNGDMDGDMAFIGIRWGLLTKSQLFFNYFNDLTSLILSNLDRKNWYYASKVDDLIILKS